MSISGRLLVPQALLALILLAGTGWAASLAANRAEDRSLARLERVRSTIVRGGYPVTPAVLAQLADLSGDDLVLRGLGGEVTASRADVGSLTWEDLADEGELVRDGEGFRYVAVTFDARHPSAGQTLVAMISERKLRADAREAAVPVLAVGLIGLGLLAVVTLSTTRSVSRKLREVRGQTRRIAGGDFTPARVPGGIDELRDLAADVNLMASELARLQEALRASEKLGLLAQVSAGLAHQMRNGLTGARLALQLHERELAPGTAGEELAVAHRQLDRTEADLTRFMELGKGGARRERFDLVAVCADAMALARPRASHLGVEFVARFPSEPIWLGGDAGRLAHLAANVLSNALEAASAGPDPASVELVLGLEGEVTLDVFDTGPGPPESIAGRLFEPFVTGRPGGVGLGLAVALEAARAHGGTLTWERVGGRTRFRAAFPSWDAKTGGTPVPL